MERPFTAYQGDEPYIFVSYAHDDSTTVYPEIQWLKDQGFNIWYDEGINPGHEWRDELGERILQTNLFLYFITPRSIASEHCKREVNFAIDKEKPLLVVYLEEAELPVGLAMSLSSIQAIMRHDLSDLDYRIKLINGATEHIRRGIGIAEAPTSVISGFSGKVLTGVSVIAMLMGGMIVALLALDPLSDVPPLATEPIRQFKLKPSTQGGTPVVRLSHDGLRLAYTGFGEDGTQIFTRLLSQRDAEPVRGTRGSTSFRFSPDDEWLMFVDGSVLKKIRLSGGAPVPVTDLGAARGFTWGPEDVLITTPPSYLGLVRIHAMGGETEEITIPGESEWHFAPILLPEGDAVLFTILNLADLSYRVAIVDLATGEQSEVGLTGFASDLTSSNHLLVTRKAVLWAAAFDPTRREVTGDAVPVLSDVDVGGVDVANDGTLVYRRGSSTEQLAWVDRDGREEHLALAPASYAHARVSPDGQQLAVIIQDPQTGRDLWIYTFDRDVLTRLTFDATTESMPEWHGDGRRLVFGAVKTGMGVGLYTKANDGTGPAELLMRDDDFWYFPTAWASDDNTILFDRCTQGLIDCNIWVLDKGDTASARPLWESQFNVRGGTLSPDGKWLAYQSDESGQMHVYVRPFPNVESKQRQVSRDGGQQPVWGSNGDEIFYLGPTHMMAAPFDTLSGLNVGLPRPLFTLSNYVYKSGRNYSVSPGRNRFLMVKKLESDEAVGSTLVLNWLSELDRLVPTKSK